MSAVENRQKNEFLMKAKTSILKKKKFTNMMFKFTNMMFKLVGDV